MLCLHGPEVNYFYFVEISLEKLETFQLSGFRGTYVGAAPKMKSPVFPCPSSSPGTPGVWTGAHSLTSPGKSSGVWAIGDLSL